MCSAQTGTIPQGRCTPSIRPRTKFGIWAISPMSAEKKDNFLIAQGKNYVNFVEYGEDLTWAATLVYSRRVSK